MVQSGWKGSVKRNPPKLNFNPRLKGSRRLKPRKIIDYPNRLDFLCISNFIWNYIVSPPQSKSNSSINGEHVKSKKSSSNNRLGDMFWFWLFMGKSLRILWSFNRRKSSKKSLYIGTHISFFCIILFSLLLAPYLHSCVGLTLRHYYNHLWLQQELSPQEVIYQEDFSWNDHPWEVKKWMECQTIRFYDPLL